jgi:SAM-dependent methyltransferase
LGGDEVFAFIQCERCGLLYLTPRPDRKEMVRYYPACYGPYVAATAPRDWVQDLLYQGYLAKRGRIVERYKGPGKLLDAGCSTGEFAAAMQTRGWRVVGVELTASVAARARRRHGIEVVAGDFVEAELSTASFDAVTMWDVLEHMHSPMSALAKARDLLVPGGIIIITVPNYESFDARLFGKYWSGLDFPRHLYVFPEGVLRDMVHRVGLQWLSRRCIVGSSGCWLTSVRNTMMYVLGREQAAIDRLWVRLAAKPYLWTADLLNRGTEATVILRKPSGPVSRGSE